MKSLLTQGITQGFHSRILSPKSKWNMTRRTRKRSRMCLVYPRSSHWPRRTRCFKSFSTCSWSRKRWASQPSRMPTTSSVRTLPTTRASSRTSPSISPSHLKTLLKNAKALKTRSSLMVRASFSDRGRSSLRQRSGHNFSLRTRSPLTRSRAQGPLCRSNSKMAPAVSTWTISTKSWSLARRSSSLKSVRAVVKSLTRISMWTPYLRIWALKCEIHPQ